MAWLLNEDAAFKAKFLGLTVHDINGPSNGRPVTVRWKLSDTELAEATYPLVMIEHSGMTVDHEREHRGRPRLPYAPEGMDPLSDPSDPSTSPYFSEFPIPYNLDYQVSVYCRKAQHNIELLRKMANENYLHPRDGFLIIPQESTIRRLDVIGGPEPVTAKDKDGKRLFLSIYTIRVSAELLPSEIDTYEQVVSVDLDVSYSAALSGA